MKRTHVTIILFLIFLLLSRFVGLTNKPLHFDESINGWFVMQMDSLGFYKYDPNNYHGPLYFYLLQLFELCFERSVTVLRSVPAFFSVLSVLIFFAGFLRSWSFQRWIGLLLLASPAFLFFGRSGIHEMPFVFFQIVFALGVFRWLEKSDKTAVILSLVGLWGMITLKETFVITLFCWLLGLLSMGPRALRAAFSKDKIRGLWDEKILLWSLSLLILFVFLFTGGFKNPQGLLDFGKAFLPWLKTGTHGSGHEKEFLYWVKVLLISEPLVLVGVFLSALGLFSQRYHLRVISVFSLSQFLIYSLIPYKTVWCILSLVWGFYWVLAQALTDRILWSRSLRFSLVLACAIGLSFNIKSAYLAVFKDPMDLNHPYVYVNSTFELQTLEKFLLKSAEQNPKIREEMIQIGIEEHWPWPWLLRGFSGLRYDLCRDRLLEEALIYFCEESERIAVEGVLSENYWRIRFLPRQSREPILLYLKKSWFPVIPFKDNVDLINPTSEVR